MYIKISIDLTYYRWQFGNNNIAGMDGFGFEYRNFTSRVEDWQKEKQKKEQYRAQKMAELELSSYYNISFTQDEGAWFSLGYTSNKGVAGIGAFSGVSLNESNTSSYNYPNWLEGGNNNTLIQPWVNNTILGISIFTANIGWSFEAEKGHALKMINKYMARYGQLSSKYMNNLNFAGKVVSSANTAGSHLSFISAGLGFYEFSQTNKNWGDYGKLGITLSSSALTYTPEPITTVFGITLGIVNATRGFQNEYDYLNTIEQSNNKWINLGIYTTTQQKFYFK